MYSEQKEALAQEIELKRPAVLAVSGLHNSGKTTLLEKLLPALRINTDSGIGYKKCQFNNIFTLMCFINLQCHRPH